MLKLIYIKNNNVNQWELGLTEGASLPQLGEPSSTLLRAGLSPILCGGFDNPPKTFFVIL